MEDTFFTKEEVIKVCKVFKEKMHSNLTPDYRGYLMDLTTEEKKDPELLEISNKAAGFIGDEWDFIHALMGSPGFDDIMEEG